MAGSAVKTDADIDQDILATRGDDWRRGGVGQSQTRTMREHTATAAPRSSTPACAPRASPGHHKVSPLPLGRG